MPIMVFFFVFFPSQFRSPQWKGTVVLYENMAYHLVSLLCDCCASSGGLTICTLHFVTPHPFRLCRWRTAQTSLFSLLSPPSLCTTYKSRMVPRQFFSSLVAGFFARPSSPALLLSQYVLRLVDAALRFQSPFFEGQPDSLLTMF